MDRAEAKAIIAQDGLEAGIWFADPDARANRVVIQEDSTGFAVYVTTERGSAEGVRHFDSESDALEKYIRLLRAQQRLLDRGVI